MKNVYRVRNFSLILLLVRHASLCYFIGMRLFMLILFPAAALFFANGLSRDVLFPNKHTACFLAFWGLVLGALYCACDWIFFLPVHFAVYSYIKEFLSLCIAEVFIPFVLCLVPLAVLFRESFKYKLRTFSYILFGFYAVQLPYFIMERYSILSPFLLFIRPVLGLGLCISVYNIFALLQPSASGKGIARGIVTVPLFVIMFFAPTVIETAWFLGADAQIWAILSVVYIFISFAALPLLAKSAAKTLE